jgi:hypothetical protein
MNADAAPKQGRSSVWNVVLFLIALAPVVCLGWLISATAVNVLKFDEWDYVYLFSHFASHTLTLHDLLQQHNESRPLVQKMIILGVGAFTHWDVRWDMWIEFAFTCVISLNIYLLSRRVTGMNRSQCLFLWIVTNLLLFSTEQSQNWTWGFQMIICMPMLFISTGMLVAYSGLNVTWKFALAIVLATAATFSFAIGQIAWIILLPPLIVGSRQRTRRFAAPIAAWGVAGAANLWVYYRGYYKPPWHPSLLYSLKYPIRAMEYFTAYLGAALAQGYHNVWLSIVFGAILLGCLAGACAYLWKIRRQPGIPESATTWLMLCAYSLASAGTATAGRLGFGVIQSQDSRYTGFSIYLVIGLVYLGATIVREVYRLGDIIWARVCAALGMGLVLIPYISTEIGGFHQMRTDRRAYLTAKACVQLMNVAYEPDWLCHPRPPTVIAEVGFLEQMGYLSPGLVKSRDVTKIAGPDWPEEAGRIDAMIPADKSSWLATGWGIVPYRHDPAEVVLLAGEDGSGSALAFAHILLAGGGGHQRQDVAQAMHNRNYRLCGWHVAFKSADVPPGTKIISAWIYDPETGRAHRLGGARPIIPAKSAAKTGSGNLP